VVGTANVGDHASSLVAVAAAGPDDVWAVGFHRATGDAGRSPTETLIEHWDGAEWRVVPSPEREQGAELVGVAATSTGEVLAVGSRGGVLDAEGNVTGVSPLAEQGSCAS
jgi:hypothetical protein